MSLALTFAALRAAKPDAKVIVWPRMDQKSCLKAIVTAGFTPIVVENLVEVGAYIPTAADCDRYSTEFLPFSYTIVHEPILGCVYLFGRAVCADSKRLLFERKSALAARNAQ